MQRNQRRTNIRLEQILWTPSYETYLSYILSNTRVNGRFLDICVGQSSSFLVRWWLTKWHQIRSYLQMWVHQMWFATSRSVQEYDSIWNRRKTLWKIRNPAQSFGLVQRFIWTHITQENIWESTAVLLNTVFMKLAVSSVVLTMASDVLTEGDSVRVTSYNLVPTLV